MYARSPDPNRQSVKVPENYGGHAFSRSGAYSDMPPPARIEPFQVEEDPRGKDMNVSYTADPYSDYPDAAFEPQTDRELQKHDVYAPSPEKNPEPSPPSERPSIFSALMPPNPSSSARFPFGHGIGSEELLIIAMMLMVYLADGESADNELLLLLGLLLFAG